MKKSTTSNVANIALYIALALTTAYALDTSNDPGSRAVSAAYGVALVVYWMHRDRRAEYEDMLEKVQRIHDRLDSRNKQ